MKTFNENTTLYLVTYNDCYGNGDDTSVEGITNDPDKWLEEHNQGRENDGEEPEHKEEFDFERISLYLY